MSANKESEYRNGRPTGRAVQVLHLEDHEDDHLLVVRALAVGGIKCNFTWAKSRDEFIVALQSAKFDLILADYTLPSFDGDHALQDARRVQPDAPFIFFSGTIGEDLAVECVKRGATDYVLKQRPARLVTAIRQALENSAGHARLRAAEALIREQSMLLDQARDAIIVCNLDRTIRYWNRGAERLYGWDAPEVLGRNVRELLFKDNPPPQAQAAAAILEERGEWNGELPQITRKGHPLIVQSRVTLVRGQRNLPASLLIINTDITEQKQYEEQLLRSQRMESLGALASGIAHDLNNALAPIIIGAQLLLDSPDEIERDKMLAIIQGCAERSTAMVRQILGFARGSKVQHEAVGLGQLVSEMGRIVEDTFPKTISLNVELEEGLPTVFGNPTELHQVILNLCINARDAMPQGGTLTIWARHHLDSRKREPGSSEILPENCVVLTIADSGKGIPADIMPRIFEPFFTTKAPHKGTGLGLSTVATIVKNHHGTIHVQSEVGKGTRFEVCLPASKPSDLAAARPSKLSLPVGHSELILVMEDEAAVRHLTKLTLENYGFRVLTALSGFDGITTFDQYQDEIKLVFSDSDMPLVDGLTAIRAIQRLKPEMPIIVASGTKHNPAGYEQIDTAHLTVLRKPYSVEQLVRTVARVIASQRPQPVPSHR